MIVDQWTLHHGPSPVYRENRAEGHRSIDRAYKYPGGQQSPPVLATVPLDAIFQWDLRR